MFTGIIQAIGTVSQAAKGRLSLVLPFPRLQLGESIAINGVCLTIAAKKKNIAIFDVGPETRRVTTLGRLRSGEAVNLERALRVGDALGGHWVTGHVETTARVIRIETAPDCHWLTLEMPKAIRPYLVLKGSIAIDGISLTLAAVSRMHVRVMILPHTWTHTTLSRLKPADSVNVEPDILAKYVLRAK